MENKIGKRNFFFVINKYANYLYATDISVIELSIDLPDSTQSCERFSDFMIVAYLLTHHVYSSIMRLSVIELYAHVPVSWH